MLWYLQDGWPTSNSSLVLESNNNVFCTICRMNYENPTDLQTRPIQGTPGVYSSLGLCTKVILIGIKQYLVNISEYCDRKGHTGSIQCIV